MRSPIRAAKSHCPGDRALRASQAPQDLAHDLRLIIVDGETPTPAAALVVCKIMCETLHMATNLAIDPELLDRALAVGGEKTKKATVTRALMEFIARREQGRIRELFGTLDWDSTFDYKSERSRS